MNNKIKTICINIKLDVLNNDTNYNIIDIVHLYRRQTERYESQGLNENMFYHNFSQAILKVLVKYGNTSLNIVYNIGRTIKDEDIKDVSIYDIKELLINYYNNNCYYDFNELSREDIEILNKVLKHCIIYFIKKGYKNV